MLGAQDLQRSIVEALERPESDLLKANVSPFDFCKCYGPYRPTWDQTAQAKSQSLIS